MTVRSSAILAPLFTGPPPYPSPRRGRGTLMLVRGRVWFVLAMAWREGRAARRRTLFLTVAIGVGVAALVAINSFTDNLRESVRQQARALLGADLALSSGTRLSPKSEAVLGEV